MAKQKQKSLQASKNKTVSSELLDSYREALYKIKQFFDEFSTQQLKKEDLKNVKTVLEIGEKLGKNIDTLSILEKKVQLEEMNNQRVRGGAKLSLLENGDI